MPELPETTHEDENLAAAATKAAAPDEALDSAAAPAPETAYEPTAEGDE